MGNTYMGFFVPSLLMEKRLIAIASLALCVALAQDSARPQQAPDKEPVFSVDVRLVNVAFSVRGHSGNLVSGLTKGDFDIYEDGVRQEVRNFSRDEDSPLVLGLILDRSGSQSDLEGSNFDTAAGFLRRLLRSQDRALVVGFGDRIRLLHDFTSNSRELEMAILEAAKIYDGAQRLGPSVTRNGGTAVNDAVYWTTKEKLENVAGRKALVIIGDGEENSSKLRVAEAVEELQRADVLLYGLNNGGNPGNRRRHPNVLPYLCEDSGGREFRVGTASLSEAFDRIEAELRGLYSIGYVSSQPGQPGQFRKIEIRTKFQGLTVKSRPGYFVR
jgi:Ca-activated chloride channel family protein